MNSSSPESIQIHWTWEVQSHLHLTHSAERADLAILAALETRAGIATGEIPLLTRSQLKRLMDDGHVTVDKRPIRANLKLKLGMVVEIQFPPPLPSCLIPENRPMIILYEDEHLLVVNKPPRLTVHPSSTQMTGTLVHALLHHIQDLSGIGGVLRPGIVHRIDKNTSGALVITKTDLAHTRLAEIFAKHQIERSYWALCYGSLDSSREPKKVESLIGRSPTDRKKMSMTVSEGRKAITYFKRLEEYSLINKKPFASLIEATLETGRTHQVRVHLTGLGHSILGDPAYGTPTLHHPKWLALPKEVQTAVTTLPGQALHARVLGFEHPISGKKLHFEAALPEEFEQLKNACRKFLF